MVISIATDLQADFSNKGLAEVFKTYEQNSHFAEEKPHLNTMRLDVSVNHFTDSFNLLAPLSKEQFQELKLYTINKLSYLLFSIYEYTKNSYPTWPTSLNEWDSYINSIDSEHTESIERIRIYKAFRLLQDIGTKINYSESDLELCLKMIAAQENLLRTVYKGLIENTVYAYKDRIRKSTFPSSKKEQNEINRQRIIKEATKIMKDKPSLTQKEVAEILIRKGTSKRSLGTTCNYLRGLNKTLSKSHLPC